MLHIAVSPAPPSVGGFVSVPPSWPVTELGLIQQWLSAAHA
jgi:hypothetical protein